MPSSIGGRPEILREQVERALRRLKVDRLELLQLHRMDPEVPLADPRDLRTEGRLGRIGLSEVTVADLGATPTQVALAWLPDRSPVVLPIPGTNDPGRLEENLAAERIELTADHRAILENARTSPPN